MPLFESKTGEIMSEYIKEFKGRNQSGAQDLNFLWNENNVYVMDNHRAAYWCWMQRYQSSKKYNLFHIDAHLDTLKVSEEEIRNIPDICTLTIDDYLELDYRDFKAIRWDNYLSLCLEKESINELFMATYKDGNTPQRLYEKISIHKLNQAIEDYVVNDTSSASWIMNVDLDYFFYDVDQDYKLMMSDEYI
ncbi:hypothetical protein FLM01_16020, partial [Vibrio cholerae]|uniref:UPF0489 family protein n=1 Tax=Vibrio cholerae TaxID=666 RepID=UPI00115B7323